MITRTVRYLVAASIVTTCLVHAGTARADMTKEQCLDAHSRGQDAKEQNKLSLARKLFLSCAQASCPAVVQNDCARFADDLSRLQPSITFVARDGNGDDLPDTTVYIDGELIVTHLDGEPHDIDPGSHVIKFENGGKEKIVTIVIGGGEKGRTISATFGSPTPRTESASVTGTRGDLAVTATPKSRTTHATGAKVLLWGGAALMAGGATFAVLGMVGMPSNCSLSTHQCAAAPGDSAFSKASSAALKTDIGWTMGITGLAAAAGGLVWYFSSAHTDKEHMALAPWVAPGAGGVALGGEL